MNKEFKPSEDKKCTIDNLHPKWRTQVLLEDVAKEMAICTTCGSNLKVVQEFVVCTNLGCGTNGITR